MTPSFQTVIGWFILFALFHSITAHEWFKKKLAAAMGDYFVCHFWRVIYCAISILMLKYGVYEPLYTLGVGTLRPIPLPDWLLNILAVTFFAGVFLTYWAFLEFDFLEFLGLKQLFQGTRGLLTGRRAKKREIAGTDRLVIQGVYHVVRHPMLAGGFLMSIAGPPFLGTYLYSLLFFIYMIIGVYYEERRLVKNLGQQYLDYKNEVGAFFPKPKQFVKFYKWMVDYLGEEAEVDTLS